MRPTPPKGKPFGARYFHDDDEWIIWYATKKARARARKHKSEHHGFYSELVEA